MVPPAELQLLFCVKRQRLFQNETPDCWNVFFFHVMDLPCFEYTSKIFFFFFLNKKDLFNGTAHAQHGRLSVSVVWQELC